MDRLRSRNLKEIKNFSTYVSDEVSEMLENRRQARFDKTSEKSFKVKSSTDQQILIASKGTTVARIRYI